MPKHSQKISYRKACFGRLEGWLFLVISVNVQNRTFAEEINAVICSQPRELICADIFGPLPPGKYGYKYTFVFIDVFTKFVILYALRNITAKICTDKFINVYCLGVGKPERILTDNATMFHSKIWNNRLKENNIKPIHCTVRYPEDNK